MASADENLEIYCQVCSPDTQLPWFWSKEFGAQHSVRNETSGDAQCCYWKLEKGVWRQCMKPAMVSGQPFCGYKHWSKTMPFTNPKLAQPVYQEIYGTDAGEYKLVAKKLASITKDGFMQTKTVEKIRKRRSGAANESVTKSREETMRLLKLAEESEKKFAAENALADQTLHTTLTQSSFASTPPQYKPLLLEGNVEEVGEKLSGMKVDNNKATDITNELEALRDQSDVQLQRIAELEKLWKVSENKLAKWKSAFSAQKRENFDKSNKLNELKSQLRSMTDENMQLKTVEKKNAERCAALEQTAANLQDELDAYTSASESGDEGEDHGEDAGDGIAAVDPDDNESDGEGETLGSQDSQDSGMEEDFDNTYEGYQGMPVTSPAREEVAVGASTSQNATEPQQKRRTKEEKEKLVGIAYYKSPTTRSKAKKASK
ncbi:hypothetical protein CYMTET_37535 [Cymbomonas tetramitiformis]|uniref:Uncharacterized protein n=2 Tax=Cymbomonas tetramitiformis TaxID=36881 RepID=A0AAE0CDP3_9CHLO|nr:hypothetical protein CYMTET_37535 [Cymbomonas tetramitiformis]